jgi:hypothetical protein
LTQYTGVGEIFFLVKICYLPARFARRGISKTNFLQKKILNKLKKKITLFFWGTEEKNENLNKWQNIPCQLTGEREVKKESTN